MAKTGPKLNPEALGDAIAQQLKLMKQEVVERVDEVGLKHIQKLVRITKATAPELSSSFKRHITYKKETKDSTECSTFIWGVRPPDHRVTHLIVHGHATANGGRTWANPFLQEAVDTVLPEYEEAVKEAIRDA